MLAEQGLTTPLLLADGLQEGEGGWLSFSRITREAFGWRLSNSIAVDKPTMPPPMMQKS